jgi:hypothetical protein
MTNKETKQCLGFQNVLHLESEVVRCDVAKSPIQRDLKDYLCLFGYSCGRGLPPVREIPSSFNAIEYTILASIDSLFIC